MAGDAEQPTRKAKGRNKSGKSGKHNRPKGSRKKESQTRKARLAAVALEKEKSAEEPLAPRSAPSTGGSPHIAAHLSPCIRSGSAHAFGGCPGAREGIAARRRNANSW